MGWFFRQSLVPLFREDDRAAHLVLVGLMAAFVGLVVFVTVALDHPFQGAVTPSESGFRRIAERPFGGQ